MSWAPASYRLQEGGIQKKLCLCAARTAADATKQTHPAHAGIWQCAWVLRLPGFRFSQAHALISLGFVLIYDLFILLFLLFSLRKSPAQLSHLWSSRCACQQISWEFKNNLLNLLKAKYFSR
jgi:hypothetical protein